MKRLAAVLLLGVLAACGNPPGPSAPKAETTSGFAFNPVTQDLTDGDVANASYTAYCSDVPEVSKEAPVTLYIGVNTVVYWADIPFPHDGDWYCAVTAKTSDFSESSLSSTIGVKKDGSSYYRL